MLTNWKEVISELERRKKHILKSSIKPTMMHCTEQILCGNLPLYQPSRTDTFLPVFTMAALGGRFLHRKLFAVKDTMMVSELDGCLGVAAM